MQSSSLSRDGGGWKWAESHNNNNYYYYGGHGNMYVQVC